MNAACLSILLLFFSLPSFFFRYFYHFPFATTTFLLFISSSSSFFSLFPFFAYFPRGFKRTLDRSTLFNAHLDAYKISINRNVSKCLFGLDNWPATAPPPLPFLSITASSFVITLLLSGPRYLGLGAVTSFR